MRLVFRVSKSQLSPLRTYVYRLVEDQLTYQMVEKPRATSLMHTVLHAIPETILLDIGYAGAKVPIIALRNLTGDTTLTSLLGGTRKNAKCLAIATRIVHQFRLLLREAGCGASCICRQLDHTPYTESTR